MGQCLETEEQSEVDNSSRIDSGARDAWNKTTAAVERPHTELGCQLYTFIVYVVVFGSMVVFGVVGNSLSFVVLNMDRQSHVATFLLQTMAVVDNAFLLTTGFTQILPAYSLFVDDRDHPLMLYLVIYVHPLVHITQLATVWITVTIAFNRYIAICQPFRAPQLCTMTRVRLQVAAMMALIIFYNIPRFCEHCVYVEYDSPANQTPPSASLRYRRSALGASVTYNIFYENVLYCLFVFLGPLVLLLVMNTCLIRELLRARRRLASTQLPSVRRALKGGAGSCGGVGTGVGQQQGVATVVTSSKHEDQEQNITLVMIVIVLVYLFCQTPAYVNQLLYYVLGEEAYACGTAYFYYYHMSNLVVSANSSLNFVIYCVFRRQFRQRLSVLCRRRVHRCCCRAPPGSTGGGSGLGSGGRGGRFRESLGSEMGHSGSVYSRVTFQQLPDVAMVLTSDE